MKTLQKIAILLFGLLLAGCASTQSAARGDTPSSERTTASTRVDERYVAYVESVARHRGTEVMWVNMPQKRASRPAAPAE